MVPSSAIEQEIAPTRPARACSSSITTNATAEPMPERRVARVSGAASVARSRLAAAAVPPSALEDDGDDDAEHFAHGVPSLVAVPAAGREPRAQVKRHRRDHAHRLPVLLYRRHDLARMQLQAGSIGAWHELDWRAGAGSPRCRRYRRRKSRSPLRRSARAADSAARDWFEREPCDRSANAPSPSTWSPPVAPARRASSTSRSRDRGGRAACRWCPSSSAGLPSVTAQ